VFDAIEIFKMALSGFFSVWFAPASFPKSPWIFIFTSSDPGMSRPAVVASFFFSRNPPLAFALTFFSRASSPPVFLCLMATATFCRSCRRPQRLFHEAAGRCSPPFLPPVPSFFFFPLLFFFVVPDPPPPPPSFFWSTRRATSGGPRAWFLSEPFCFVVLHPFCLCFFSLHAFFFTGYPFAFWIFFAGCSACSPSAYSSPVAPPWGTSLPPFSFFRNPSIPFPVCLTSPPINPTGGPGFFC